MRQLDVTSEALFTRNFLVELVERLPSKLNVEHERLGVFPSMAIGCGAGDSPMMFCFSGWDISFIWWFH